jgi:hypothetical protein
MIQTNTPPSILTFTVVAALVTTAGTLLGHFLKEVALARSFEVWKQGRTVDALYRKYRDPLVLSAIEFANRLGEILAEHPADFLTGDVLAGPPPDPACDGARGKYFLRYKYQSTVYRLSAFLGWVELYRQDLVFLDTSHRQAPRDLEEQIRAIRADMADGHLNEADNGSDWCDALIFREEQRALGEAMIVNAGNTRTIMGYGAFIAAAENPLAPAHRWIRVAINFLADPGRTDLDFRLERYRLLFTHLVKLADANEPTRVSDRLRKRAGQYATSPINGPRQVSLSRRIP